MSAPYFKCKEPTSRHMHEPSPPLHDTGPDTKSSSLQSQSDSKDSRFKEKAQLEYVPHYSVACSHSLIPKIPGSICTPLFNASRKRHEVKGILSTS